MKSSTALLITILNLFAFIVTREPWIFIGLVSAAILFMIAE
jgi:hypothetical protein